MILIDKHDRFALFLTPKCASESWRDWYYNTQTGSSLDMLNPSINPKSDEMRLKKDISKIGKKVPKVQVIRNPYTRAVSAYLDKVSNPKSTRYKSDMDRFHTWISYLYARKDNADKWDVHWRPQVHTSEDYTIDTYILTEFMEPGIDLMCTLVGEEYCFPPHNKAGKNNFSGDLSELYRPDTLRMLNEIYAEDIELYEKQQALYDEKEQEVKKDPIGPSFMWTSPYNSCWPATCYGRAGGVKVQNKKVVRDGDLANYVCSLDSLDPVKDSLLIMGNFVVDRKSIKRRALQAGMDVVHGEDGFFPHYRTLHADPIGFCWESSLPQMLFRGKVCEDARKWSEKLRKDAKKKVKKNPFDKKKKHVIFPLQLIQDKVNQYCLNIRDNWVEVLDHARKSLPGDVILHVKGHPRAKAGQLKEKAWVKDTPNTELFEGDLYTALAHCDGVIGVNSTVLTEARLLFDKPVWSYGDSWYSNHTALVNKMDLRFRPRPIPFLEHLEKGIPDDEYLQDYRDWYIGQLLARQYTQKVEGDPERYVKWLLRRTYNSYLKHGEDIFGFEGVIQ